MMMKETIEWWGTEFPVICSSDDTVKDALQALEQNQILSVPIQDSFGYRGFVDMLDLVNLVTSEAGDLRRPDLWTPAYWAAKTRIRNRPLDLLLAGKLQPPSIRRGSSIFTALELMAMTDSHRLPVVNFWNKVVGVICHSDMINFFTANIGLLPDAKSIAVSDIRPYNFLTTVREYTPAIRAFEIMANKGVYALGVVNAGGCLVDCLSIRDLRGVGPGTTYFRDLFESVSVFKSSVRKRFPELEKKWNGCVLRTDSLLDVIQRMAEQKIHRVFVVNNHTAMVPLDVITQTDVIHAIHTSSRTYCQ
jgi:CBS-domain-containing membrane protein